jgi:hypothetical protein
VTAVALTPDELRKLVRRDLTVAVAGGLIAVWTYSVLAATALGLISELTAGRVEVAVAVVVSAVCVWWWAAGPRGLLRDRYLVVVPVFLIAPPGLIGLHNLGAGAVAVILSGAVGFSAAVALGLAYSARHRPR